MADKKPSGFRFRLPWLLQSAPTPAPEPPTQSPRTTTQTSVASTFVQRPPFRPPGKAPTPAPAPTSPTRSPLQPPPSPSASAKSSVPKSPIAETIEPVPTQPTKETQTTTETVQTTETIPAVETQPTKETQTATETIPAVETPPRQPQSQQPSSPQSPPQFRVLSLPLSPTSIRTPPDHADSQSRSPSRMATPTKPSSPSSSEASSPRSTSQPSSPSHTPPRSPSKTSSSPAIPEIKRSTEITKVKGAQTKSMNIPHSMETKSQKPKPITASTRVPLHREIKDDISKFIHKIATTSTSKQSMNEQLASVITIAGDNTGAFMHLNSDAVKREIKQDSKLSENEETKAVVNSNIQGINNSMMFNSSVSERNPGVHLVITRNLSANMNDSEMKNADSMEMQRAEFNVSPTEKVIYNPTIGRSMQANYEPDDFETDTNSYEIEVL